MNIDACPNMIKIISCQITNRSMSLKVIPGAEVTLALELFSNFPDVVKCDEIAVALAHSEPLPVSLVLEAEKKKLRKTHSGGAKRTLSNSSTSSSVGATGSNSGRSTPMLSREESGRMLNFPIFLGKLCDWIVRLAMRINISSWSESTCQCSTQLNFGVESIAAFTLCAEENIK